MGRLGNQLYQYAALVGIAHRLGLEATIPPYDQHELAGPFASLSARVHTPAEAAALRHTWVETRLGVDPSVWGVADGTDLRGFFQSPWYFPPRSQLLAEYRFRDELLEAASEAVGKIRERGDRIVGMAVRLGDFVANPEFLDLAGTSYYDDALRVVRDRNGEGTVIVVSSDDPETCRGRITGPDVVHLDDLLAGTLEHLAFLTLTDELVISNSTFAWWAAYLGPEDRPVVTARRWFSEDGTYPEGERERHPGWQELEVAPQWCGKSKSLEERRADLGLARGSRMRRLGSTLSRGARTSPGRSD